MAEVTIYADDSCWWERDRRKFVEPTLYIGRAEGSTWSDYKRFAVVRFPQNMAATLQNAKIIRCDLVFTASSVMDRQVNVNFTTRRPNPSTDSLYTLQRYVTDTWRTLGVIDKKTGQNENAVFSITDKDILLEILNLGLVFFSNDEAFGSVVLYSSRAADQQNAPKLVIEYSDNKTAPEVEILSPKAEAVDGSRAIVLRWDYRQDVNTPQSHYSVEYSVTNGGTWIPLAAHAAGSGKSFTIPAGALPMGSVQLRVRAWSSAGIASDWDSTIILVRSAPRRPSISSVGSTPRPVVQWQSENQQAYQVEIIGYYTSDTVWGNAKRYQVPVFLEDGEYTFRVRVQNEIGLWSEWASAKMLIANDVDENAYSIAIFSRPLNGGVEIKWETKGTFREFYVYRDGNPVARVDGKLRNYVDYFGAGDVDYQIRAVLSETGHYLMSHPTRNAAKMDDALLSRTSVIEWITLNRNRGGSPVREKHTSREVAYFSYDGREMPVAQVSDFMSRTHNYQFTVGNEDAKKLESLCGELVIYKDKNGRKAIGILNDLDFNQLKKTDVSFSITEVDYKEFIGYEI